jgi:mRNA interferase RelE/StbE
MPVSARKQKTEIGTPTSRNAAPAAPRLKVVLKYHPAVEDDLDPLPEKHYDQIERKLAALELDPYPADRTHMTDWPDVYRIDCGEYRIGFTETKTATEHIISIKLVDRRNDKAFFKRLKRRLKSPV